jgi:hypothetical protein
MGEPRKDGGDARYLVCAAHKAGQGQGRSGELNGLPRSRAGRALAPLAVPRADD